MKGIVSCLLLVALLLATSAVAEAKVKTSKKKKPKASPVVSEEASVAPPASPAAEAPPAEPLPGEPAEPPAKKRKASSGEPLTIRVPPGAKVRAVSLSMEGAENTVVEDQSADEPNSVVTIGWARGATVGFKNNEVTSEGRKLRQQSAIFYVFSGVVSVKEFEIIPAFFKRGDNLEDSGSTPAIFRIEVLELDRIGDAKGKVVQRLEGQALKIGEANRFTLDAEIDTGKKAGVRVSVPADLAENDEMFVQVKAAKKGKFPVRAVAGSMDSEGPEDVRYSPQVKFVFLPRAGDIDTFSNPSESLASQINRYIERHGGNGDVEIPLKLKVEYK